MAPGEILAADEVDGTTTKSTTSVSDAPLEMIHQRQTTLIRKQDGKFASLTDGENKATRKKTQTRNRAHKLIMREINERGVEHLETLIKRDIVAFWKLASDVLDLKQAKLIGGDGSGIVINLKNYVITQDGTERTIIEAEPIVNPYDETAED